MEGKFYYLVSSTFLSLYFNSNIYSQFYFFSFSTLPPKYTLRRTLEVWSLWLTISYLWFDVSWLGSSALIWMEMEFWHGMNCNFFMRSNCIEWSAWPKNLCFLRIYCARLLTWLDLRFVFQCFFYLLFALVLCWWEVTLVGIWYANLVCSLKIFVLSWKNEI